jgi:ABC-2 family transporter
MAGTTIRRPALVAGLLGVAGAVVATVLGFLTFGAQATVAPHDVPLAVASPPGQLHQAAEKVAAQGGGAVDWRVTDPDHARDLLADKDVYGILELGGGQQGVQLTIVTSGAVNPQGTQAAAQVLTGAAQGLAGALSQQGVTVSPPEVETVDPASVAGRAAPLAASALLWVGGLAAGIGFALLASRERLRAGALPRLMLMISASVLGTAVIAGFIKLWDSSLPLNREVLGFILLTALAFTAVQGALLRLFKLRAAAILGPLYLIAPAVAGQVPEMLNPTYRALLWSWTPFRFSTEGLRSVLLGTPDAPDVRNGIIVLASMAVVGLIVVLWPIRTRTEPPTAAVDTREPALTG